MKNTELANLYQEVILDHSNNPRNFGQLEYFTHHAKGNNPLCGDSIEIFLDVEDNIIKEIKFNCSGCAISKASASLMTTILKGKNIEIAKEFFETFHAAVTCDTNKSFDELNLGKLSVFCGIRKYPARVKCASLAWHTLVNAINNSLDEAKTE